MVQCTLCLVVHPVQKLSFIPELLSTFGPIQLQNNFRCFLLSTTFTLPPNGRSFLESFFWGKFLQPLRFHPADHFLRAFLDKSSQSVEIGSASSYFELYDQCLKVKQYFFKYCKYSPLKYFRYFKYFKYFGPISEGNPIFRQISPFLVFVLVSTVAV